MEVFMFKKSIMTLLLTGLVVSSPARAMYTEAATLTDWATVAMVAYVIIWTYNKIQQQHEQALENRFRKSNHEDHLRYLRYIDQRDDEQMRKEGLLP